MFGTEVFQVTPSVWCVRRRSYLTCSYIVRLAKGVVLIDAGMASSGVDVWRGLSESELEGEPLRCVLVTHWHNDHGGGVRAVQKRFQVPVFAHRNEIPYLTGETARGGFRGWLGDRVPELGLLVLFKGLLGESSPRPVTDVIAVSDGDVLEEEFEVIETPGHTPGHIALLYRSERVLFAGDALAVVHGRVALMARPVTPELDAARASTLKLLALDIDVLCPGHRRPLSAPTRECERLRTYLEGGGSWPLLGVP